MKSLDVPVNARSGAVACDVLRSFLKSQLRDDNSPVVKAGFTTFDVGIAYEVTKRPFEQVAVQEVVRDESVLRTWLIDAHLYTAEESAPSCSLCWQDFLSDFPTDHAHEDGSREALAAEAECAEVGCSSRKLTPGSIYCDDHNGLVS